MDHLHDLVVLQGERGAKHLVPRDDPDQRAGRSLADEHTRATAPPAETALPGALAGIVWMLFVTQTTFSVPSLMGSIMCIGVATANSILMVVFANDQRLEGMDERAAALAAGTRASGRC